MHHQSMACAPSMHHQCIIKVSPASSPTRVLKLRHAKTPQPPPHKGKELTQTPPQPPTRLFPSSTGNRQHVKRIKKNNRKTSGAAAARRSARRPGATTRKTRANEKKSKKKNNQNKTKYKQTTTGGRCALIVARASQLTSELTSHGVKSNANSKRCDPQRRARRRDPHSQTLRCEL